MTEATFTVRPTVIVRAGLAEDTYYMLTLGEGDDKALMVFRAPEEAAKYQQQTGNHAPEQGFRIVTFAADELEVLLEAHGLGYVAIPEP